MSAETIQRFAEGLRSLRNLASDGAQRMAAQMSDAHAETARAAPAVVGSIATGFTQSQIIGWATGLYIVVQLLYLLRKWYREEKDWHPRRAARPRS